MLGVWRDHFLFNNTRMRTEIRAMHTTTINELASKGILYDSLKTALIPIADRNEAAFVFDSTKVDSSWYGKDIMHHILPLLDRKSTQSILCGDIICEDQRLAMKLLQESLQLARSLDYKHSTLLFCVYLNNMSEAGVSRLHQALKSYKAYVGHIPTTYLTRSKILLSTCLVNIGVKVGGRFVLPHEDDRPNSDDVNLVGYPFGDFGYQISSIQETYFGIFLSFKIECPISKGHEVDTEISLNSVSHDVLSLSDLEVLIEDRKLDYLLSTKQGKMAKAGIATLDRGEVSGLIKAKLMLSYIYNMTYLEEHDVSKFNLLLEFEHRGGGHPTRMTAALEYRPIERVLRLITLH